MSFRDGHYLFAADLQRLEYALSVNKVYSGWSVSPVANAQQIEISPGDGLVNFYYVKTTVPITLSFVPNDAYPTKAYVCMTQSGNGTIYYGVPEPANPSNTFGPYCFRPVPPQLPSTVAILAELWIPANANSLLPEYIVDRRVTNIDFRRHFAIATDFPGEGLGEKIKNALEQFDWVVIPAGSFDWGTVGVPLRNGVAITGQGWCTQIHCTYPTTMFFNPDTVNAVSRIVIARFRVDGHTISGPRFYAGLGPTESLFEDLEIEEFGNSLDAVFKFIAPPSEYVPFALTILDNVKLIHCFGTLIWNSGGGSGKSIGWSDIHYYRCWFTGKWLDSIDLLHFGIGAGMGLYVYNCVIADVGSFGTAVHLMSPNPVDEGIDVGGGQWIGILQFHHRGNVFHFDGARNQNFTNMRIIDCYTTFPIFKFTNATRISFVQTQITEQAPPITGSGNTMILFEFDNKSHDIEFRYPIWYIFSNSTINWTTRGIGKWCYWEDSMFGPISPKNRILEENCLNGLNSAMYEYTTSWAFTVPALLYATVAPSAIGLLRTRARFTTDYCPWLKFRIKFENATNALIRCGFELGNYVVALFKDSISTTINLCLAGNINATIPTSKTLDSNWHDYMIRYAPDSVELYMDSERIATYNTYSPASLPVIFYIYNTGTSTVNAYLKYFKVGEWME